MMRGTSATICAGAVLAALFPAAGCRIEKDSHGDKKDVNIATPFGGMHVKTNDAAPNEAIGLAAYPGAVPVKKNNNNDASADVDMHFGSFQLRVKAATYRTGDSMDKVEAFYRNDLKRYGDVIACRGHAAVGEPTRTMAGLTCEDNDRRRISVDDSDRKSDLELKAGSRSHQHIVGLKPESGGTQFALVALELPTGSKDPDPN